MKRVMVLVALLALFVNAVSSQVPPLSNKNFVIKTESLHKYLNLNTTQFEEVSKINAYFLKQQENAQQKNGLRRKEKKQDAVYGNLKLMKKVLDKKQYQKYVTVLNLTNNAYLASEINVSPDSYLAEIK